MGPLNRKDDRAADDAAPGLDAGDVRDRKPDGQQGGVPADTRAPARPPNVSPHSEWRQLVTGLGALHLGCGARTVRPRPKVYIAFIVYLNVGWVLASSLPCLPCSAIV